MSGVNVNIHVTDPGLARTLDAIAIRHGGRPVGSSGNLRSYAIPSDNLEAFCQEAERDPNTSALQTNPPEARRNFQKLTPEGRQKLLQDAEPTISLLAHIDYSSVPAQRMDITDLSGKVYENVEHDFKFKDGLSIVYEQNRYYFPLTSILSIKIRNPGK